jgi:SAM-dependent methyltransferase
MNKHISCPSCGGSDFKSVRKPYYYRGKREEFNIDACGDCGFWLTNPFPEGQDLAAYYETEDYVSHTDGKGSALDWVYNIIRARAIKSKFRLINSFVNGQPSLVDYGAGTGAFLSFCQTQGWKGMGFEPSAVARENAATKGLTLLDPSKRDELEVDSVDVFTLWHVLEHIPDLNDTLRYFNSRLKSEGLLVIAVPNHESYDAQKYKDDWAAYDVPLHLWHFAKSDISNLGSKHGFKVEEIVNMPFDSFYVSLLSEKNRHGSMRPKSAFLTGLKSNLRGAKSKNMSSLIYILRKA